jgi:hypothetical protein
MLADHPAAIELHRAALRAMTTAGQRQWDSVVVNDLAITVRCAGDPATALDLHDRALRTATQQQMRYEKARAHDGIAACTLAEDPDRAREHWMQALTLFAEMGVPERHAVAERLAALDRGGDQLRNPAGTGRMDG